MTNVLRVIDILGASWLIYRLLTLIRGTRAWRILGGVVFFILMLYASAKLHLTLLHWILDKATLLAPVALVILLLPELRQALEGFGKFGLWPQKLGMIEAQAEAMTVEEIVAGVAELASSQIGALIVIERGAPLQEIISNGVTLNAKVSAALLGAIFYEGNPLHDGAAVIREDTIVAAACRLPLSDSVRLDSHVHMRHRAAVGVTEERDTLVIVVSEERGTISIAYEGKLKKLNGHNELRDVLNHELRGAQPRSGPFTRGSRTKPKTGAR